MPFPSSLPLSRVPPPREAPSLRWGIMGSGWIAERFIESVRAHTTQDLVAVGSRSRNRAEEFAARMGLAKAYSDGLHPTGRTSKRAPVTTTSMWPSRCIRITSSTTRQR